MIKRSEDGLARVGARTALITGSAGFIGYHLALHLLRHGWRVVGLDGMTPYYDVTLKEKRHEMLAAFPEFTAHQVMLEDARAVADVFAAASPDIAIHLAAQAGVRYSLEAPRSYLDSNVIGTFNVMEAAQTAGVDHLLMASSSSVYGANTAMPYAEMHKADLPMSLYAATKKAGEAMAHAQSHLWGLPVTMFRFFTVYGPWGRPDMALFKFVRAILNGDPIDIYNHGQMRRDFTYVDDLVAAIVRLIDVVPSCSDAPPSGGVSQTADSLSPVAPFRILNVGNAAPVPLMEFVTEIERALGMTAQKRFLDMQQGDVPATWADTDLLHQLTGQAPATPISTGIPEFVAWYRDYYGV